MHIRVSQREPDKISIEFFDSEGIAITKAMERKIETTFFKEDFPRCLPADVGSITFPSRVKEYYADEFLKHVKGQVFEEDKIPFCIVPGSNYTRKTKSGAIATQAPKVVIDYAMAETGVLLPDLLGQIGIETVVLNSSIRNMPPRPEERIGMRKQLADVVKALNAELGVQIGRNGEQMTLVDETGQIIRGELLLAVVADIILRDKPGRSIVVPVNSSSTIERIAARYNCRVVRCKASETEIGSTTAKLEGAVLGGSANGCFIFPEFQNGYDAMFTVGQVLEHLTFQGSHFERSCSGLAAAYLPSRFGPLPVGAQRSRDAIACGKASGQTHGIARWREKSKPDRSTGFWFCRMPVEPLVRVYADGLDLQQTSTDLNESTQLVRYLQNA